MAAASYTVVTLIDSAKSHVNDIANTLGVAGDFDGLGGTGSDDLAYKSMMLDNLYLSGEQTVKLTKQTTGIYAYTGGMDRGLWFASSTTPFTGEDDCVYQVFGKGPKVFVKSGSPTATEISITGAWVNFKGFMADVFLWLADTKATQIALAVEGQSIDPGAVRDALVEHARLWQGVITSAT